MNIHEYQAKEILRRYNVPVLKGKAVFSADEASLVAKTEFVDNGINVIVLKSQIHAGGRGKGIMHDTQTKQPLELYGKPVRGVTVIYDGDIAEKAKQYAEATFNKRNQRELLAKKWNKSKLNVQQFEEIATK